MLILLAIREYTLYIDAYIPIPIHIEKAKKRLLNSTVKKKNWDGAARMKVRSTNELQHEKKATLQVEDQAFNI